MGRPKGWDYEKALNASLYFDKVSIIQSGEWKGFTECKMNNFNVHRTVYLNRNPKSGDGWIIAYKEPEGNYTYVEQMNDYGKYLNKFYSGWKLRKYGYMY